MISLAGFIVLAVMAAGIYANSFPASFVFDDYGLIVDNPQIRMKGVTAEAFRDLCRPPCNRILAMASFALNYAVHGLNAHGYRLVNLLIHVITAWLIFRLTRQTLRRSGTESDLAAFFTALIWLVIPIHTQSVTYIVQRMNALAALFYLLSLSCYVQARESRVSGAGGGKVAAGFVGCLLAGVLGLVSKETVATLPAFLFLYEWFFFQNLDRKWLKKHLPRLGMVILVCGLIAFFYLGGHPLERIAATYQDQPFTPVQRLLTEPAVIAYYLSLLVYPHPNRLILDYDFPQARALTDPATTLLSLAALAALVIMAVVSARKNRLLSFAIAWFFGNLAIESSVIGLAPVFEHRLYLPTVMPVMAGVTLMLRYVHPRRAGVLLMAVAIGVGGLWTWQRNRHWQNEYSLWRDGVMKTPANPRACHNLALALDRAGDSAGAIDFYRQSLGLAISRLGGGHPEIANIGNNLGASLLKTRRFQEAREYFELALRHDEKAGRPDRTLTVQIFKNLGITEQRLGNPGAAIGLYQQALAVWTGATSPPDADIAEIYNNLGVAYGAVGDRRQAEACYRRALMLFRLLLGEDHPYTRTAQDNLSALEVPADGEP